MPRPLKPFIDLRFLRCVDLDLIGRLLDRHAGALQGFDPAVLTGPEDEARAAIEALLGGARIPDGLAADLHRIAALGDAAGWRMVRAQAARLGVSLTMDPMARRLDPRHAVLLTFLDHPAVFDAASDMLALARFASLGEFLGEARGIPAILTDEARATFERRAARICEADHRGSYCRVGWYGDGASLRIVVTHGSLVRATPIVDGETERVISYRRAQCVVISYAAQTGRLEIGGAPKVCRRQIAELFAATLLDHPGFFAGHDAQDLYTLAPIERAGGAFAFHHAHDPGIRSVRIVEARADRTIRDAASGRTLHADTVIVRASCGGAMVRLAQLMNDRPLGEAWRLRQVVLRILFDGTGPRPISVPVRLRPPATAAFRRDSFEDRIMTLLRRNGLVRDRDTDRAAVAAQ